MNNKQQIGFLILSVSVNLLIARNININVNASINHESPPLRINLMALAAPKAIPQHKTTPEIDSSPIKNTEAMRSKTEKPIMLAAQSIGTNFKPIINKQAIKLIPHVQSITKPTIKKNKIKKEEKEINNAKPLATLITKKIEKKQNVRYVLNKQSSQDKPQIEAHILSSSDHNIGKQPNTTIIQEAKLRRQTPPRYPRRALELGHQGIVTLHAKILPNGKPEKLKIAESSGYRLLDRAALSAVKKWQFEPTNMNGSAITSWVSVPVRFIIH